MASGMQQQKQQPGTHESNTQNFPQFDSATDFSDHKYSSSVSRLSPQLTKSIMKEWKILENSLPESILVRVYENRIDLMRAVIIGPPKTPYHNGLFFFDIQIPTKYPSVPPLVKYHSFGLRLNPNLYENGYVCLSLLNTWYGPPETKWRPGKSTILQVLLSLQALVLNEAPFYNEPIYSNTKGKYFKNSSLTYSENTFLLSTKTMLYLLWRPPKNFESFVSTHFRENSRSILTAYVAYVNGFVEVGKFEDESSYLNTRIRLSKLYVGKMREHLLILYQNFAKKDPSLVEFGKDLDRRTEEKCAEYEEKLKEMYVIRRRKRGTFMKLFSNLFFACGSGQGESNAPPVLLRVS